MNNKIVLNYRKKAEFFKAFAHPIRLLIISRLMKGEMCVNDIKQLLGLKQANVSQHLNILRRFGIVDYKIKGKNSLNNNVESRFDKLEYTTGRIVTLNIEFTLANPRNAAKEGARRLQEPLISANLKARYSKFTSEPKLTM